MMLFVLVTCQQSEKLRFFHNPLARYSRKRKKEKNNLNFYCRENRHPCSLLFRDSIISRSSPPETGWASC